MVGIEIQSKSFSLMGKVVQFFVEKTMSNNSQGWEGRMNHHKPFCRASELRRSACDFQSVNQLTFESWEINMLKKHVVSAILQKFIKCWASLLRVSVIYRDYLWTVQKKSSVSYKVILYEKPAIFPQKAIDKIGRCS